MQLWGTRLLANRTINSTNYKHSFHFRLVTPLANNVTIPNGATNIAPHPQHYTVTLSRSDKTLVQSSLARSGKSPRFLTHLLP
jgi:hypothetical protein